MRRLIIFAVAFAWLPIKVTAQDPADYHIIFGNRDGSPITVPIGAQIEVPIWGSTDPEGGDTVAWMNDPLEANSAVIISRDGGFGATVCDTFLAPIGSLQTHMRFADEGSCLFNTGGDTVLIGTFRMTVTNNPNYIGQIVCPFTIGYDPRNGGLLWSFLDGIRSVVPTVTLGCLHVEPSLDAGEPAETPADVVLYPNYPNPFNPETNIRFSLPQEADVSLVIYNISGQRVRTLIDGRVRAGLYLAQWDGTDDTGARISSGIYFCKLSAPGFARTNSMILIR